jgi:hypothetical protein
VTDRPVDYVSAGREWPQQPIWNLGSPPSVFAAKEYLVQIGLPGVPQIRRTILDVGRGSPLDYLSQQPTGAKGNWVTSKLSPFDARCPREHVFASNLVSEVNQRIPGRPVASTS